MNDIHWHTGNNLPHYVAESGPRRYETLEESKAGLAADMSFVADGIEEWLRDVGEDDGIRFPERMKVVIYRAMAKRIIAAPSPGGTWSVEEDEWSMDVCNLPNCKYGERGMS